MNIQSKGKIRDTILKDILSIHEHNVNLSKRLDENFEDHVSYLQALATQLSQPSSGPLVTKTPKIVRKRAVQRIETIPEDEVLQQKNTSPAESLQYVNEEEEENNTEEVMSGRAQRRASKRAANNIKKQCSLNLSEDVSIKKTKRESQIKRKKSASSTDEEDGKSNSKYSKLDENLMETKKSTKRVIRKKSEQVVQPIVYIEKTKETNKTKVKNICDLPELLQRHSNRNLEKSRNSSDSEKNKVDGSIEPNADDIEEPSMYEDAIGKPIPIMNSTLKHNSDIPEKVLNATVVLERLPQQPKLNETVVIKKASSTKESNEHKNTKKVPQNTLQLYKENTQYNSCSDLITEDESPPEIKKLKKQLSKKQKQTKRILSSSEDEIPNTPAKTYFKDAIIPAVAQESKTIYKPNALFSPYAKESVKKRVEAFEQAVINSPNSTNTDASTRMTRTKTRALMNSKTEPKNEEKNVTQMLARKSLAKAKKMSLAREKKDNEEFKENKEQVQGQINKLILNDIHKYKQQKTTPVSKMAQPLLLINRLHTPSNTQNLLNYQKISTVPRANIVTSVDTFIQPPKSIGKTNSVEKLEDKKRYEDDARKKREEALKLQTEEKRRKRQEKELRNKLAREAKEKQELEKRQKAEKEREEKAKLAFLMQERQREELEKKRLAQLQRMQEKEERRKLEEQQKLKRLQEQEETERLLAEQRRREQEAEKRREAEARAQQAAAEAALKQKNLAAQAKFKQQAINKPQGATNYVLDSDPDDDESDDENKPKHEIPYWAQSQVRKAQLAMQRYIPQEIICKFFDTRKCTPDLTELFHGIDRTRLKRTSSAIWKTPPRISMMDAE